MKRILIAYLIAGAVYLPLDLLWLRTMGQGFYRDRLGDLIADEFRLAPGIAFYLLYLVGICVFVLQPAFTAGTWLTALAYGAFFGLVAYGTYDLTNHATLRDWSLAVTIVDMLWGAFATGVVAVVAYWLTTRFVD